MFVIAHMKILNIYCGRDHGEIWIRLTICTETYRACGVFGGLILTEATQAGVAYTVTKD